MLPVCMRMMATVPVRFVLFSEARELVNLSERNVNVPNMLNCRQLRQLIFHEIFKDLSPIEDCCILALNQEYVDDHNGTFTIAAHSEIAVIPPISGG
ncbi:ThiS family protein [Brugia pahangi]